MRKIDKKSLIKLTESFGTPLYIFDEARIRQQCKLLKKSVAYPETIFRYACKALSNSHILKVIKSEGFKIDASSFNEVLRSLRVGFKPSDILYTGESADKIEFKKMLELGVPINCSSIDQIKLIATIKPGSEISVRFNPGEGHGYNQKVNTGGPRSKHGIYLTQKQLVKEIAKKSNLRIIGIHTHIGSGTDLRHWLKIKDITLDLARDFADLKFIDLGGGFPVIYNPRTDKSMPIAKWGKALSKSMLSFSKELGRHIELQLEPGRFIVAESGTLVAEVQNIKTTPGYNYALVNTGFNHNPRPVMYGAFHPIEFIQRKPSKKKAQYVIAGNLCESGDIFTVDENDKLVPRQFPKLSVGDLMVMGVTGAYSYSMMSEYNSMNLPAAVLIQENGKPKLIERRGTFEDLLRREVG